MRLFFAQTPIFCHFSCQDHFFRKFLFLPKYVKNAPKRGVPRVTRRAESESGVIFGWSRHENADFADFSHFLAKIPFFQRGDLGA